MARALKYILHKTNYRGLADRGNQKTTLIIVPTTVVTALHVFARTHLFYCFTFDRGYFGGHGMRVFYTSRCETVGAENLNNYPGTYFVDGDRVIGFRVLRAIS
jgi:hypothetical protein